MEGERSWTPVRLVKKYGCHHPIIGMAYVWLPPKERLPVPLCARVCGFLSGALQCRVFEVFGVRYSMEMGFSNGVYCP